MKKLRDMRSLRIFNFAMFLFHTVQGIFMLIWSNSFSLPITTSYLSLDQATRSLQPQYQTIAELYIGPLVAMFFFLSALAHLFVSLPWGYEWYTKVIKKGMNPARWIEYSLSSSLMMVIIAMVVGAYDLSTLILLFFVNAGMILFGWMMELHNQITKKTNWTSFIFGTILGLIPWVVVVLYLIGDINDGTGPPAFVYGIFFSIFFFFSIFAVNMVLQYKKVGPWKNYLYGEYVYIILSLVAKSLLAWQVWANTLRPM